MRTPPLRKKIFLLVTLFALTLLAYSPPSRTSASLSVLDPACVDSCIAIYNECLTVNNPNQCWGAYRRCMSKCN